jgi:hypothetical protein
MSAQERVYQAQMPAPVAKLLDGGGEQVLRGRKVGCWNNVQVAQHHDMMPARVPYLAV